MFFVLKKSHLEILASFFTDLAAAWFITMFGAKNVLTLTGNLLSVIFSLVVAFKLQSLRENS